MTVNELATPTAAQSQEAAYNSNIGGGLKRSAQFSVPDSPQISWAVVGLVVADSAVPADIEATLIPAIEALTEVTSVNGDQVWGQVPATIENPAKEAVVYVTTAYSAQLHTGNDAFNESRKATRTIKPPLNKKWVVMILRVPSPLDSAAIGTLESAITGVTGVTSTSHLISGETDTDQSGNGTLNVDVHLRIDAIPV